MAAKSGKTTGAYHGNVKLDGLRSTRRHERRRLGVEGQGPVHKHKNTFKPGDGAGCECRAEEVIASA